MKEDVSASLPLIEKGKYVVLPKMEKPVASMGDSWRVLEAKWRVRDAGGCCVEGVRMRMVPERARGAFCRSKVTLMGLTCRGVIWSPSWTPEGTVLIAFSKRLTQVDRKTSFVWD